MSRYTALLDANVFYPAPMRDLFLQLAVMDVFRAKWTADIHREWIEALLRNEPHRDRGRLERTRDLMDAHVRDCLVTGYEVLIPTLTLPDQGDRHVLAAAIIGRCDAIVTQNTKHFPPAALDRFGIEAQHPDEFLLNQLSLDSSAVCVAIRKIRARLANPSYNIDEYLSTLSAQGLVGTAAELTQFIHLL